MLSFHWPGTWDGGESFPKSTIDRSSRRGKRSNKIVAFYKFLNLTNVRTSRRKITIRSDRESIFVEIGGYFLERKIWKNCLYVDGPLGSFSPSVLSQKEQRKITAQRSVGSRGRPRRFKRPFRSSCPTHNCVRNSPLASSYTLANHE